MQTTRFGLKSLPTYYKGITFRSRLEARWAIVFDELGIKWEYEPEAIEIEANHFSDPYNPSKFAYLPDFYLTEIGCMIEVKGDLNHADYWRLMRIVHHVTTSDSRDIEKKMTFCLAGNLGEADKITVIKQLFNDKGYIMTRSSHLEKSFSVQKVSSRFDAFLGCDGDESQWPDFFDQHYIDRSIWWLCQGQAHFASYTVDKDLSGVDQWNKAVQKARSVRFDRGHYA